MYEYYDDYDDDDNDFDDEGDFVDDDDYDDDDDDDGRMRTRSGKIRKSAPARRSSRSRQKSQITYLDYDSDEDDYYDKPKRRASTTSSSSKRNTSRSSKRKKVDEAYEPFDAYAIEKPQVKKLVIRTPNQTTVTLNTPSSKKNKKKSNEKKKYIETRESYQSRMNTNDPLQHLSFKNYGYVPNKNKFRKREVILSTTRKARQKLNDETYGSITAEKSTDPIQKYCDITG